MAYNNFNAAALDASHVNATDAPLFNTEAERDFFSFLNENPNARLALQTVLMRYAYTLTFEELPVAPSQERLSEIKGATIAVRTLLDMISKEGLERTNSMTARDLQAMGLPEQRAYG